MIMAFPIPPHHHQDQTFMFDESHEHHHHDLIIPSSSTLKLKRSMSFSGIESKYNMMMTRDYEEEAIGEKKIKRLSTEQVKALEKSFEAGNKLEGERKMELAKSLGLEPRQIAIWFQNRRARWKTKQLEKEYEALKRHFHSLNSQNHALKAHNLQLHAQLEALKGRDGSEEGGRGRLKKEREICWSNNGSEINSSDIIINNNLDTSTTQVLPSKPTQLFQCSSTSQSHPQDESFSNILFHGIHDHGDGHHNFWPSWPDHHHFHH